MFFKSLTCRTPEIVAVAKDGLRQVIQQLRMPKDLLQRSLRPILVNLAHTKSLTMPLLQGLARLLELLSNWFNVTLGVKLLDHIRKWLEHEKLAQSQKSWKAEDEPKVAAGMLSFLICIIKERLLEAQYRCCFSPKYARSFMTVV
ncbi:transformation/transcription domain-associated protein-like [Iris pallida]|uniref:Transformation/transcription domain-associated protein-like n=1 Tax=Iris pallida TaxID=29817 RepID=A0AAX6I0S1_IRIPA|nr:transformation/transcription domain-associated protein-like [Iris pallida]